MLEKIEDFLNVKASSLPEHFWKIHKRIFKKFFYEELELWERDLIISDTEQSNQITKWFYKMIFEKSVLFFLDSNKNCNQIDNWKYSRFES